MSELDPPRPPLPPIFEENPASVDRVRQRLEAVQAGTSTAIPSEVEMLGAIFRTLTIQTNQLARIDDSLRRIAEAQERAHPQGAPTR